MNELLKTTKQLNRISIYSHDRDGIVDFWDGFGETKKPWGGTVCVDNLIMVKRVV